MSALSRSSLSTLPGDPAAGFELRDRFEQASRVLRAAQEIGRLLERLAVIVGRTINGTSNGITKCGGYARHHGSAGLLARPSASTAAAGIAARARL